MRSLRPTSPRRRTRFAATLVAGLAVALALVWAAPRASGAAAGWMSAPQVRVQQLSVPGGLTVAPLPSAPGSAPANGAASAALAPSAEPAPASLDAGMRFSMAGLVCDTPKEAGAVIVRVRTSLDGVTWTRWREAELQQSDQAGDAGASYIDPLWVKAARYVQVSARAAASRAPVRLTDVRVSAIDSVEDADAADAVTGAVRRAPAAVASLSLTSTAAAGPAQPAMVTRSQWGADESLRKTAPSYAAVKMAFVHHTDTGNDYTSADAPAIVRGIYAYHTKSLGWNDIGYNFLIDRFGTIYEGRYGGVARGVVGAQVLGFNTGTTGISIIGTYTAQAPSAAAMASLEKLLAWKLSLGSLDPRGTAKMTCGYTQKFKAGAVVTLPVIAGHRDANNTECPGDALYAKLPVVRSAVALFMDPVPWTVTLSLSTASVRANGSVTYAGAVTGAPGTKARGVITVQRRPAAGGEWKAWRTATLSAAGTYSFVVKMTTSNDWQLRAQMPAAGGMLTGHSSTRALSVREAAPSAWRVTLGLSKASASAGTTVRYSGTVKTPAGRAGTGVVAIQRRPSSGGAWKVWRSAQLNATGGYALTVRMTVRAAWQVRACMSPTSVVLAGFSSVKALRVL